NHTIALLFVKTQEGPPVPTHHLTADFALPLVDNFQTVEGHPSAVQDYINSDHWTVLPHDGFEGATVAIPPYSFPIATQVQSFNHFSRHLARPVRGNRHRHHQDHRQR